MWFEQFDKRFAKTLRFLLRRVIYVSEEETTNRLLSLNSVILNRLEKDGLSPNNIIYIQIDSAGSSSAAMLNKLRDAARLERKGCRFLDSKDIPMISEVTDALGEGAIIYIDDFIGTGRQFSRSQKRVREYVVGNFSEFLVAASICEEALSILDEIGVEVSKEFIHYKNERPLHEECTILNREEKENLVRICGEIHPQEGLGFKRLATMVVLYRNSPNTVPLILRGSLNQNPYKGILPKTTDLPIE
jgi:hypothetical protein